MISAFAAPLLYKANMDDGGWGELFANAAGSNDPPPTNSNKEDQVTCERETSVRKKNGKRKRNAAASSKQEKYDSDTFTTMLDQRLSLPDPEKPWHDWMDLSTSFIPNSCHGWKSSTKAKPYSKCSNCRKSALHHKVVDNARLWPLQVFCVTRNLRCCAKSIVLSSDQYSGFAHFIREETQRFQISGPALRRSSQLPPEEAELLDSKIQQLKDCANACCGNVHMKPLKSSRSDGVPRFFCFEQAIRLIIACDAVYYRLYYLQITGQLPELTMSKDTGFLPHPSDYFGAPFLNLDPEQAYRAKEKLLATVMSELSKDVDYGPLIAELQAVQNPSTASSDFSRSQQDDALSTVHRVRLLETISLFYDSEWSSSSNTKKQVLASLTKPIDNNMRHETPAPQIMVEWRDSCRDFMCNLYAYAALAPCDLLRLVASLSGYSDGVAEIGAGTGYLAKLLQTSGCNVNAWDVHPTDNSSINEYHGFTAPFCKVGKASNFPLSTGKNVALLLCYPPPQSSMACDTLKAYLRVGGTCIVVIGEFKGLTGDKNFERLLVKDLDCQQRFPCLTWGTDASEVTVWVRKENCKKGASSLLLPCSFCGRRESTKRCRLLRATVYCSNECCEKDNLGRNHRLRLSMIELDETVLDFENEQHYSTLGE
jgi:hypothetical protein